MNDRQQQAAPNDSMFHMVQVGERKDEVAGKEHRCRGQRNHVTQEQQAVTERMRLSQAGCAVQISKDEQGPKANKGRGRTNLIRVKSQVVLGLAVLRAVCNW